MTKTNIILALIVLALGVVAGVMVLAPDLIDKLPKLSQSASAPIVKATPVPKKEPEVQKEQHQSKAQDYQATPPVLPAIPHPETQEEIAEIKSDFSMAGADMSVKSEDYEDWRIECAEMKESKTICNMFQRLAWESDKDHPALMVMLTMAEREGKPIPRMRMIAPLGTFLPAGMALAIEGEKELNVNFQFCSPDGCVVTLDLADDVINQLKSKDSLKVGYLRPNNQVAQLKVSLKGFSRAYERLTKEN